MNALARRLRDRAPLPFRDFMAAALYDPGAGYYTRNIRTIGQRGDFSTSTSLSPALANALAHWLRRRWADDPSLPRHIIEIGAGDGSLAAEITRALGWRSRRKLRYHIVDTSPPLRARQQQRLAGKRHFRWHGAMTDALDACGHRAIILSNELVDAFPTTLLQWRNQPPGWREVMLDREADGPWLDRPDSDAPLPPGSSLSGAPPFPDGQRVERHDSYFDWLATWLPAWRSGEMLTIDYGDTFPALYHRRPRGTLRAYFAHARLESLPEILARPGHQDITADVDFTDLQQRGAPLGLHPISLCTQSEFITHHGGSPTPPDEAFKILHQKRTDH